MSIPKRKIPTSRSTEDYKMKYLEEKFDGLYGKLDDVKDHLETIDTKLTVIETQTTKTNSRVNHLETELKEVQDEADKQYEWGHKIVSERNTNCPLIPKMTTLEEDVKLIKENLLEYNFFKKYPKAAALIIAFVVFTIGMSVYTALSSRSNNKKTETIVNKTNIERIDENTR